MLEVLRRRGVYALLPEKFDLRRLTVDRDSIKKLLGSNYSGLLTLLRQKIRDEHLAADLLNQAVVTSLDHVNAARISDPASIAGYVFQVAMNHLRNHQRKMDERSDRRADPDLMDSLTGAPNDTAPDQLQISRQVREILEELPTPRDREIVKRFYLDEDEKADICRDLGLSPLHFDKVIFRARQRMRALLEAKGFKKTDFFSVLLVCFA